MSQDQFANIARLEVDLWDAADDLRTNSKLTAGEYSCGRAHAASISFTISAPSGGNLRAILLAFGFLLKVKASVVSLK